MARPNSSRTWPFAAFLVAAGLWAYWGSFAGVLILDDPGAITWNSSIRSIATSLAPTPNSSVSGRPVANLTFAINYALAPADARDVFAPAPPGGPEATTDAFLRNIRGYHAVNLAIHLAAALVLFGVVRRTLLTPRLAERFGAASTWLAFAVSLIWVVHPVHTEAVTYVVQRVESLAGLFCLLTLYFAIRNSAAGAVICCALGMATKETMVVTPVIVWLWYRTFLPDARPRRLLYLLFGTWLVLVPLVLSAPRGQTAGFNVTGWTPWTYLLTQTDVIVHYFRLIFVPSPLVFHYAWPKASALTDVIPQAAFLTALFALTVFAIVRRNPLGFIGAWFFLVLAPSSSIVPVMTETAAEHRLYLPAAAVIALVVIGVYALGAAAFRQRWGAGGVVAAACTAAIVIAFGIQTSARNLDYTSEERMWRDNVDKQPDSPRGRLGYGVILVSTGRAAEAESHLRMAVALEPMNPLAHRSLGLSLAGQQKYAEAMPELRRSLELFPEDQITRRAISEVAAILQRGGR